MNAPSGRAGSRLVLTLGIVAATATTARAQEPNDDIAAAARAFEEGQRAQLRRNYAHAAELFELADRIAPSSPALRSAIRNFEAAENHAQAANLALQALERYPADAETKRLAATVLSRLTGSLGYVVARCAPGCSLVIDGRADASAPSATHQFYLPPGDHVVLALYDEGRRATRALKVSAGTKEELWLEPSAPRALETTASATRPTLVAAPIAVAPARARRRRLPPLVTVIGAGLTVGVGAALLWSGLDTLAARDRYVGSPTEAGYRDGLGREARTDAFIGCVAVLGVATVAVAAFGTDWRSRFAGGAR